MKWKWNAAECLRKTFVGQGSTHFPHCPSHAHDGSFLQQKYISGTKSCLFIQHYYCFTQLRNHLFYMSDSSNSLQEKNLAFASKHSVNELFICFTISLLNKQNYIRLFGVNFSHSTRCSWMKLLLKLHE